jgi:hypothetical protein
MVKSWRYIANCKEHYAYADDGIESIQLTISRVWQTSCGNSYAEQSTEPLREAQQAVGEAMRADDTEKAMAILVEELQKLEQVRSAQGHNPYEGTCV